MSKASEKNAAKLGVRFNLPYLQGAYLALNAIPDAYFLGDGPSCIMAKAEQIHGRHDLFSTLLSCGSDHRIHYTGVNVFNIAGNFEAAIASALKGIASRSGCAAVFMGSMPMCSIAGTDYERILREALAGGKKPAFLLPRRSAVSGDWLDGYAAVMEVMASEMDLGGAKPSPKSVAVVGNLMDRNEGEHRGNILELKRMLRALGLEPVSIWLSGSPYESLREVRRAGAIISLPHGRKAASILARRLGVKLVETGLPFGLEGTRRFVEQLGREFGKKSQAEDFIRAELDAVIPRLEWSVPHTFLNRRFVFVGDPHYAAGFAELIENLGGKIPRMIIMGGSYHLAKEQRERLEGRPGTVFEPMMQEVEEQISELSEKEVDLLVTNSLVLLHTTVKIPWIEFGYPSEYTHFLKDEPFLGFQGALALLSRMANGVTQGMYTNQASA